MNRRKLIMIFGSISLVLAFAVFPFLTGCRGAPAEAPGPITLKAISGAPIDDPLSTPLLMLRDKVNERSNGELIIEVVGGPEVISEFGIHEAVAGGRMDVALLGPTYSAVIPGAMALMLSEYTPAEERASGAYDYFNEVHQSVNLYYLGRGHPGEGLSFLLWSNVMTEGPDDLVGLKTGDGTILPSGLREVGMIPTTVEFMEIYGALERGVIDALVMPAIVTSSMHFHEQIAYVIDLSLAYADGSHIINLEKLDSLPSHLQELLKEAALEVEQEAEAYYLDLLDGEMQTILDSGVEVIEFSAQDSQWLLDNIYEGEWAALIEQYPDIGPSLQDLFSK